MLTRIYKYKIRSGSEKNYLQFQEKVLVLYKALVEVDIFFLRDDKDATFRTEIIRFGGKNPYEDLKKVDADPHILKLFSYFQSELLDPRNKEIHEETLKSESLSSSGKIHHIEIYCSHFSRSKEFWGWFLKILGYKVFQEWNGGISFKFIDTYIVFVQAQEKHLSGVFHRCQPGLNHLAFHASSKEQVDEVTNLLKKRNVHILYEHKHPHAGGSKSYAVFFEDPERIKVELIAP